MTGGIWNLTSKLKLQFLFPFIACSGSAALLAVAILQVMPRKRSQLQSQRGIEDSTTGQPKAARGDAQGEKSSGGEAAEASAEGQSGREAESLGKFAALVVLLANSLAAGAWTAMDPTLQLRLHPLGFTPAGVGMFFLLEGVVYTVGLGAHCTRIAHHIIIIMRLGI